MVAAVSFVDRQDGLDASRIVLFGWSNGGWAVMDALSFGARSQPTNLKGLPETWAAGVRFAVLFYPYCGFGARSKAAGWHSRVASRMYLAELDENVSCAETGAALAWQGVPIGVLTIPGATHWFDNPAGFDLLPHRHDAAGPSPYSAKTRNSGEPSISRSPVRRASSAASRSSKLYPSTRPSAYSAALSSRFSA